MEGPAKRKDDSSPHHVTGVKAIWGPSDNIEPVFADHLFLIQLADGHFHMTFGQTRLPLAAPNPDTTKANIHPLATFIIPRDVVAKIAAILNNQLEVSK